MDGTRNQNQGGAAGKPFRLALTGARTFYGEALVAAMEQDPLCEDILCLDIRPPRSAGQKTRHFRLDLTHPLADEHAAGALAEAKSDVLAHLAFLAFPSHARSWAHELEAIGTFYLMNAAASVGIRKVVMTSTTMAYGAYPSNPNFLSEDARLKGMPKSRWVRDKVAAERELARLHQDCPEIITTALRFGTVLGPTIRSFHSGVFRKSALPVALGYDPLMQFLHEDDAVAALLKSVREDHQGAVNIVGAGVLPYSQVRRLGGKLPIPVLHTVSKPLTSLLWGLQLADVPPSFLNFFRFSWVAEGRRMREEFGFHPSHSSKETLQAYFASLSGA